MKTETILKVMSLVMMCGLVTSGCSSPVAPDERIVAEPIELTKENPAPDFTCFYIDPWNRVCVEAKYAIYEAADLITGGKGCWPCI
jgi:hypothetical protein